MACGLSRLFKVALHEGLAVTPGQKPTITPEIGAFYAGGGMTCRVLELLEDDDVRVEVVLRGGKLFKRRLTGVIPLRSWDRMTKTTDPVLRWGGTNLR